MQARAHGQRTWLLGPMLSSATAWPAPWALETLESPDSLLWEMPSCTGTEIWYLRVGRPRGPGLLDHAA